MWGGELDLYEYAWPWPVRSRGRISLHHIRRERIHFPWRLQLCALKSTRVVVTNYIFCCCKDIFYLFCLYPCLYPLGICEILIKVNFCICVFVGLRGVQVHHIGSDCSLFYSWNGHLLEIYCGAVWQRQEKCVYNDLLPQQQQQHKSLVYLAFIANRSF